jgi:hypothetical protein
MIVDVADAREHGLVLEMGDREYAFCSAGCLAQFAKSPGRFTPKVDAWLAEGSRGHHATAHPRGDAEPTIDQGMREWYKACRCCLSEAYPKVVETLDAEKASA